MASGARDQRSVRLVAVTPLASIFGSGFLIIIPILERTLGALAAAGMAAVCAVAWAVGMAVRHNVAVVEPRIADGRLDDVTHHVDRASDLAIALAYVVSIALYLRILAHFVVEYVSSGSNTAERIVAIACLAVIVAVGLVRGLDGLEFLDRVSLTAVLVLVTAIGIAFAVKDVDQLTNGGLYRPPVPDKSLLSVLLTLGGIVITVQGFETVRYMQERADGPTRIAASRLAQTIASVVYVGIVLLATPLMGLGTPAGADADLLSLVERVVPLLALPLVLSAVLSQFSAATADTEAGVGNLAVAGWKPLQGRAAYLVIGVPAGVLMATLSTSVIVVVASRAFAFYYALQCVVALRTSHRALARLGYGALGVLMLAITLFATPAQ
ncbi:MAG: hypothetical protein ACRDVO_03375 [Jiangellaceae bacterium]